MEIPTKPKWATAINDIQYLKSNLGLDTDEPLEAIDYKLFDGGYQVIRKDYSDGIECKGVIVFKDLETPQMAMGLASIPNVLNGVTDRIKELDFHADELMKVVEYQKREINGLEERIQNLRNEKNDLMGENASLKFSLDDIKKKMNNSKKKISKKKPVKKKSKKKGKK